LLEKILDNSDYFIVNNNDKHNMDLQIIYKKTPIIIGVECKYKKIITKNDIDKFNKDIISC